MQGDLGKPRFLLLFINGKEVGRHGHEWKKLYYSYIFYNQLYAAEASSFFVASISFFNGTQECYAFCRVKGSKPLVNALRCLFTTQRIKKQDRCLSELDRLMLGIDRSASQS